MRLLRVLMMVVAAIACTGVPARADDISAAARGVVRVVIIAQADGEELGRGHGSGFAIAPNRIVTNAHVVREAMSAGPFGESRSQMHGGKLCLPVESFADAVTPRLCQ